MTPQQFRYDVCLSYAKLRTHQDDANNGPLSATEYATNFNEYFKEMIEDTEGRFRFGYDFTRSKK